VPMIEHRESMKDGKKRGKVVGVGPMKLVVGPKFVVLYLTRCKGCSWWCS
jgi:hypothetical protein